MATVTSTAITLEEFERLSNDGGRHEINEGELITLPFPKSLHSLTAAKVLATLQRYLEKHPVWLVIAESGYILSRDPLTVRGPDVSVLNKTRAEATPADSYFEGAPELAVEIVSPSNSAEDLEIKVKQYLNSGARQVWVLYPKTKDLHLFAPGRTELLSNDQMLDGGDLLPGFSVKVSSLFAVR